MPLVAPNEGLADMLDFILSADIEGVLPWQLMLWTNDDLEPAQDTVFDDLDEAQFYGYSRWSLDRSEWLAAVIEDDAAVSTYTEEPLTWTPNGSGATIYGYALVTPIDSVIRFIEAFDEPIDVVPEVEIGVLPRVTLTTFVFCDPEVLRSLQLRRTSKPKRKK